MLRTLAPVATPIHFSDIIESIRSFFKENDYLEKFSKELCCYFDVKHCFLVSSGRAALTILLMAMRHLRPGKDEVILPAYTSFSVPAAVVKSGLKVSLCDVDPKTLSLDIESLKKAVTNSTLCIVVCHLYGYPADIEAITNIAREKGIFIIDDAAQSMGAKYKGKYVGVFGDAGIFSLNRGKNITTIEGGIIITNSDNFANELTKISLGKIGYLYKIGIIMKIFIIWVLLKPSFYWAATKIHFLNLGASIFSTNFKIRKFSGVQAAIGIRMLKRLKKINKDRSIKAEKLIRELENKEGIYFPNKIEFSEPVFLRLPMICNKPGISVKNKLGIVRSYPFPINEIESLRFHIVHNTEFPGAKMLTEKILTLPTHDYVNDREVGLIAQHFK